MSETARVAPDAKLPPEPFSIRARPKPVTRLNRKVIALGGAAILGVTALILMHGLQPTRPTVRKEAVPTTSPRQTEYPAFLTFGPKSYAEMIARQHKEEARTSAAAAEPQPPATPQPPAPGGGTSNAQRTGQEDKTSGTKGTRQDPRPARQASVPRPHAEKTKPWLFAKVEDGPAAQGEPEARQDPDAALKARGVAVFPPAKWATPADPRYVLYRSQVIPAVLLHDVNSDLPGPMRLMVTQNVLDKFQSGVVLVPQYSFIHGQQESSTKHGQQRLGMTVEGLEFPDGTYMPFGKAKAGDQTGASGYEATSTTATGRY